MKKNKENSKKLRKDSHKEQSKVSGKVGLPPGSLYYVGGMRDAVPQISIVDYSLTDFAEREAISVDDCLPFKDKESTTWINIDGIHNMELIDEIGRNFGIHSLLLEDIVNTEQRPKFEELDGLLFLTLKKLNYNGVDKELESEQISFVLGNNFVISFHEKPSDLFAPIYDRIKTSKNSIRKKGADYLLYCLIDIVVDNYFAIIEDFGDLLEDLEEEIFEHPEMTSLQSIQHNKKDLLILRKTVFPLRDLMYKICNEETSLISDSTARYFRDIYDHTIRITETLENYRDLNLGLKDVYLSSITLKMNQIMKVLTIISTIFIPLTFVVGVYGMNFDMPEFSWKYGYAFAWSVMILIAGALILVFKKKKWF